MKTEPLCFLVGMNPTKDAPFHPKRALLRIVLSESGRTVECEGWTTINSDAHLKKLVKTEPGFPARLAERAKKKMAKEQPWRQITIVDAPVVRRRFCVTCGALRGPGLHCGNCGSAAAGVWRLT